MRPLFRVPLLFGLLLGTGASLFAQPLSLPLEFRQNATLFNFQSSIGVPISTVSNVPPGSDGRMPTVNESGSVLLPTTNQFSGYLSFGAIPGLTSNAWRVASNSALLRGENAFSGPVAQAMGLPVGTSNNVVGGPQVAIILRRGQLGAPYLNRQVSFAFGSIVAAPGTDENGNLLTNLTVAYWLPKPHPYLPSGQTNSSFYWSPHAGKVYANQAGPVQITWLKAAYVTGRPADYTNALTGTTNYFENGGNYFRLHTLDYIVSGSPVKTPRNIYWTERGFSGLGKPVAVPTARVGAVSIAYSRDFPQTVSSPYVSPGDSNPGGTTNQVFQELRTLWYDQQQGTIQAYNREGRVFVELLGDLRSDGVSRDPLGFEIVDVVKSPTPLDTTIELGERILPPLPDPLNTLAPNPLPQAGGLSFAYEQNVASSGRLLLYATHETANLNDYLVHWLEQGVAGLNWPKLLGRYQFVWPTDVSKYSHYVRALVATEEEARATAVPLPTANAPVLEYQDPLDQPRGKLTDDYRYYTFLTPGQPVHRGLLRFNSAEEVAFERVFSWLDSNLMATNFAHTIATNITSVADYLNYPVAFSNYSAALATYNAYTNYLVERTRGVNGDWKLFVSDDLPGQAGSIASWSVVVETANIETITLATNEFGSAGGITINDAVPATPSPSTITVSGISNTVTTLWIKLNGLSHPRASDIDVFLVSPRGEVCSLISDAGGATATSGVNLFFADFGAPPVPLGTAVTSGAYQPTDHEPGEALPAGGIGAIGVSLDALLLHRVPQVLPPEPFVNSPPVPPASTPWPSPLAAPRVINQSVVVGQRIDAPAGEPSAAGHYLAGHINLRAGTLFNASAYIDPFVAGFDAAKQSAIIPVNAVPGTNNLEVWWFRTNAPMAGANAANVAQGFLPIYWPAAIGYYTIQWPEEPTDEIVLASNDGSGPLPNREAQGTIYYQNERSLPGFNPNEEHALMQGGQAYALRDDLNIINPADTNGYSSAPYVLLSYTASDNRPAMHVFKVWREKGADTFNYQVEAGTILQPPMPLPLLDLPLGPKPSGAPPRSLNQETYFRTVDASTSEGLLTTSEAHHFRPWFRELALQSPDLLTTKWFFATNADYLGHTLSGLVSDSRTSAVADGSSQEPTFDLQLLETRVVTNNFNAVLTNRTYSLTATGTFRYLTPVDTSAMAGQNVYVMAPALSGSWEMTVLTNSGQSIDLAQSFASNSIRSVNQVLTLESPQVSHAARSLLEQFSDETSHATRLFVPSGSLAANQFEGWQLRTEPIPASGNTSQGSFVLQDRKGNLWVYRGPHEAGDQPWMAMQYYYRTLPGFFFPTLTLAQQPLPGTITPYLRNANSDGTFAGDPVFGNRDHAEAGDNNAFAVHYRPVWPAFAPVLQMAETLTVPKRGLPAVRGQTSLEVVYQQSQVTNVDHVTVRLHDPTREKEFELGTPDSTARLGRIPDSVQTESSNGKTYFPMLPPHLSQRFFFDSNRGSFGKLVFKGEFADEIVGDKYLNLNVLSVKDATTLSNVCLATDPARARWNDAIAGLSTKMEKFVESPQQPGTYIPAHAVIVGPGELAEVNDDDVAVDSYALTAVGPGTGYVSLIAGNGLAFTPRAEPVSVIVMRVSDVLYPGELKVIQSPNPLAEQLTMQQVVDLAGAVDAFGFEWKIAAPVDGLPPKVYENARQMLLSDGDWSHVPFPLATEQAPGISETAPGRIESFNTLSGNGIAVVGTVPFSAFAITDGRFEFTVSESAQLVSGNQVTLRGATPVNNTLVVSEFAGVVRPSTTADTVVVDFGHTDFQPLDRELHELARASQPQSIVFREFTVPASYSQIWLSLDLSDFLGANVYLNGELVVTANQPTNNTPVDAPPAEFLALSKAYRLDPAVLARGSGATQHVAVELFSQAIPGTAQNFNLRLEAYEAVDKTDEGWVPLAEQKFPDGIRTVLGESSDVRALTDNYLIMRYRATNSSFSSGATNWSRWTTPQLAEGWIKRVLAGINPFNQRVTDLFNNQANTDASLLAAAGRRWEGDVALNLESINNYGLIEIYETVLRRGRMLSIDGGINYGPANDALLLAAGYLNDLYMMEGNEAWADAANPTIGIGAADRTYGEVATALFAFKGQVPSLLEEELALLRGRDDFLQPGVATAPFYNRLVWNYTRGIDAGEVIYALNYNVQENPNQAPDGNINAADASRMFPQGHGDAYGHYLTALKGYYSLLLNNDFDWVPRIEAVNVLGAPVSVDYQDERKFAAAAAAVARTGRQVFDLTWRRDYQPGHASGWAQFATTRVNPSRPVPTTRSWGVDHWANRTGQGNYIHWVVGNAILPAVDPDPSHEGIQKIERGTVLELTELATMALDLQNALDNAEGGMTPLGLPQGSLAMDINPNVVVGPDNGTHFEQIYGRAKGTLNNAVAAFDDAKNVTQLMRSEQDSLAGVQAAVAQQELAYNNELIELYGMPYTDDIGPGKTYKQGYTGPDLLHFAYTEMPQLTFPGLLTNTAPAEFRIDIQDYTASYNASDKSRFSFVRRAADPAYLENTNYIGFTLDSSGNFQKPSGWTGRRASPGKIQEAISRIHLVRNAALGALSANELLKRKLDRSMEYFQSKLGADVDLHQNDVEKAAILNSIDGVTFALKMYSLYQQTFKDNLEQAAQKALEAIPKSTIVGLAVGGDTLSAARGAILATFGLAKGAADKVSFYKQAAVGSLTLAKTSYTRLHDADFVQPLLRSLEDRQYVLELDATLGELQESLFTINQRLQELDEAVRNYQTLVARGDRLQTERQIARQRTSAVVQGYRTRDAAFRIFRNEKLERYKTLFELAARYSFLAANTYDYETGLLNTSAGRSFVNRIVSARALGVVRNGEPQYAGSNTGDPGLSSALAEMKADWDVVKTRLGFNNPDAYGTIVSLRTENFRILPTTNSDTGWIDLLQQSRRRDLLEDEDVRRHCLQIGRGVGLPVPGILVTFSTTIANGYNFFGQPLAAGDHAFSPSSFATKLFGVGAALEGYRGMDQPAANGNIGGISPPDPSLWFLDPLALAATPYVYLIPVGVDSMRSPPLGDASDIRSWTVDDVAIPLPFNLGASQLANGEFYQSADSLSEPLFKARSHQAFRPVPSTSFFSTSLYGTGGTLQRSQYTNNRLIGRSAWNSRWKLVIPGHALLNEPDEGLDRFIKTVRDIKLQFVTYSYSGN